MARGSVMPLLWDLLLSSTVLAAVIQQQPLTPKLLTQNPIFGAPLPLVIWHGLGDNYEADGLHSVGELANATISGTYTYYVRLDEDPSADRTATFLGNLTTQITQVCADLAAHPILSAAPAINAIGFSQGGQFMRAYVERCNLPPVANLVTFGAQHNGIGKFQDCAESDWLCGLWQGILRGNTWGPFVQNRLVPAQYFRDPEDLENYLASSNFLADINNERAVKNATYKANLKKLKKFVMIMFGDDKTVIPKESAFFSEVNATTHEETKLRDRDLYKEDWLGLRWLDERGRLVFNVTEGGHMQIPEELLVSIFKEYFSPPVIELAFGNDGTGDGAVAEGADKEPWTLINGDFDSVD